MAYQPRGRQLVTPSGVNCVHRRGDGICTLPTKVQQVLELGKVPPSRLTEKQRDGLRTARDYHDNGITGLGPDGKTCIATSIGNCNAGCERQ